jgi:hypothetical protein
MSRWLCPGCTWGKEYRAETHCPDCCGFTTAIVATAKLRARRNQRLRRTA